MISFPDIFLSFSGILLNLSTFYEDISRRKFYTPSNTERTSRTNAHELKQKYLSYVPSKLPFIISLKQGYILKISLILPTALLGKK